VSERRIDAEGERRLREAGFVPEASPTGKQRWQDPETGRMSPGANALEEAKRRDARDLEQAGWEREEVDGLDGAARVVAEELADFDARQRPGDASLHIRVLERERPSRRGAQRALGDALGLRVHACPRVQWGDLSRPTTLP